MQAQSRSSRPTDASSVSDPATRCSSTDFRQPYADCPRAGEWLGCGGRFSPDGGLLAFGSNRSGTVRSVCEGDRAKSDSPSSSSRNQVSGNGGTGGIAWRRDGKELFYLAQAGQAMMAVEILSRSPLRVAPPRLLFKLPVPIANPAGLDLRPPSRTVINRDQSAPEHKVAAWSSWS